MIIFQKPNFPLSLAIVGMLISKVPNLLIHKYGATLYTVAIIVWAYEELTTGVNRFRQVLGGTVLALTFYTVFQQIL